MPAGQAEGRAMDIFVDKVMDIFFLPKTVGMV